MREFTLVLLLVFAFGLVDCRQDNDADRCSKLTDPDQRLPYCTAAIESGKLSTTNLAVALNNRGTAYAQKGNYNRAIQDYDQAIRLNPSLAPPFSNRGDAYFSIGNYDRAIQDYDEGIRLAPSNADAFDHRGFAYAEKGNYNQAIQNYDEAIRLNPSHAKAFRDRGFAYFSIGNYDRATQNYDDAIRLNPNFAFAFCDRGWAYFAKGDYERAIQNYDEAIRLNPTFAFAFCSRGIMYTDKGNYDRAMQDYDEAVQLNPTSYLAFASRGNLRFYLGQFAAAQSDLATALRLHPNSPYTALWLYLVRARVGQDPRNELERNRTQLKPTGWPGPLIDLYLGKPTPEAVLSAAADPNPKTNQEQHCAAYFFLGEHALIGGKPAEAKRLFQQAIDTGVTHISVEYIWAQAELKRLSAKQAQAGPGTHKSAPLLGPDPTNKR